jgi:recombination protein RecA
VAKKVAHKILNQDIELLRQELQKLYGDDVVRNYTTVKPIPTISTGIPKLDKALGGGLPEGRMVELYGEASSGKSTVALSVAIQAQKKYPEKWVAYIDVEHALDMVWAQRLGVNLETFDHIQPIFGEDSIFIIEAYLKTGNASVVILDSVAALLPKAEMEAEIGSANVGMQARLVAAAVRRINSVLNKFPQSLVVFINQKRAKIGGGPASFMGETTKTTGGKALPFYMTTRLSVSKLQNVMDTSKETIGQVVKIIAVKHKVNSGPWGKAEFRIDNRYGIDLVQDVLDTAVEKELIHKGGSWYTVAKTGQKVQGEEPMKDIIRNDFTEWSKLIA